MNTFDPMHILHTPYAPNGCDSLQTIYKEESLRIPLKETLQAPPSPCVFLMESISESRGYLLPDEPSPAHWFWIELGPRLRRRPRCEGAEG